MSYVAKMRHHIYLYESFACVEVLGACVLDFHQTWKP